MTSERAFLAATQRLLRGRALNPATGHTGFKGEARKSVVIIRDLCTVPRHWPHAPSLDGGKFSIVTHWQDIIQAKDFM